MKEERHIIFFENHFQKFYLKQTIGVRKKIGYVFRVIKTVDKVPIKFLRHMKDGLYEIKVEYESNIFRVFCCFDRDKLVVLFNGYQKKTQKADRKSVDKAMKLKQKYFDNKNKANEQKRKNT